MQWPWVRRISLLPHHRYCQAVMLARRGQAVLLDREGIVCPAVAAAFGFRPLAKLAEVNRRWPASGDGGHERPLGGQRGVGVQRVEM